MAGPPPTLGASVGDDAGGSPGDGCGVAMAVTGRFLVDAVGLCGAFRGSDLVAMTLIAGNICWAVAAGFGDAMSGGDWAKPGWGRQMAPVSAHMDQYVVRCFSIPNAPSVCGGHDGRKGLTSSRGDQRAA